ncbi:DUF1415 domain-containing protein [bacterium]|nr:DUF1415 domain-containing protein [bacterium]
MDERLEKTRAWVQSTVIGLGLCPFADKVSRSGRLRYEISEATGVEDQLKAAVDSLISLSEASREETETTLLVFPHASGEFPEFLDFVETVRNLARQLGLHGVIQTVPFHPGFHFKGTPPELPENYTNRSPFPMLHLLREQSISELPLTEEELLQIPVRNATRLRELGLKKILETYRLNS